MLEELINLKKKSMLTIDDEASKEFTELEDYTVTGVQHYDCDGLQVVIVELDSYFLIANDFMGEPRFFICEAYEEAEDYYDQAAEDFPEEIELEGGENPPVYTSHFGYFPGVPDECAFCEYSAEDHLSYILMSQCDDEIKMYRGLEIAEGNLLL